MVFKKKNKVENVATKLNKEEEKEETQQTRQEDTDLFNMPEPQRDYVYNMRIINELVALRAAVEELIKVVKEE